MAALLICGPSVGRGRTSSPTAEVVDVDARGCGRLQLRDGLGRRRPVAMPAPELCVRQALRHPLDDPAVDHVVLRVDPPDGDGPPGSRVFVYRVAAGRLVPRFLGSGFPESVVDGLFALPDPGAFGVRVRSQAEGVRVLRCAFDGFLLACVPMSAAPAPDAEGGRP